MPFQGRFGLRLRARPPRAARQVELGLERLEELLLLSAVPYDADYESWRRQTFSITGLYDVQVPGGELALQEVAGQGDHVRALIGAGQVHQQYGITGAGYAVAVIDTGLDYHHPAFSGRYRGGWDFVDDDADPMDEEGHGTHVAGIIASNHATYGGVAPQADLIALRVLDANGSGNFGDVEAALQWVVDHRQQHNIVAVNLSLGTGNFTTVPWNFLDDELSALKSQGVLVSAASGNSYYSYGSQQGLGYPAVNDLTVSVGAVWSGSHGSVTWSSGARDFSSAPDRIISFTQRSSQLDLLAPGAFVTSAYLGGGMAALGGTSMAAPVVAGAAVLAHQALDAWGQGWLANQDHILSVLRGTGVTLVDGDDEDDNVINTGLTFKRLDVLAAIQSIVGAGTLPPATPPPDAPPPATPPPEAPAPPGTDTGQNTAYVAAVYQQVLGRDADGAGLNHWATTLDAGLARQQFVHALWTSAEHRAAQVAEYYITYLHRMPSAGERDYWVASFLAGADENAVMRNFLHSAEYIAAGPDNAAFIQTVYLDVLGRAADDGGLDTWASRLHDGASRDQVVEAIFGSSERYLRAVNQFYQDFLNRGAGEDELWHWVHQIEARRHSLQSVGELFLASQEFFDRAALEYVVKPRPGTQ